MRKNVCDAYIDSLHSNIKARPDMTKALDYVRETVGVLGAKLTISEDLNAKMFEVVLKSEKVAFLSDAKDHNLVDISNWMIENKISSSFISLEDGILYVFDNQSDTFLFNMKWL